MDNMSTLEKIIIRIPPPQYWPSFERPEMWYAMAGLTIAETIYTNIYKDNTIVKYQ